MASSKSALWRHMDRGHSQCDVTFTMSYWTHKLERSCYSLINLIHVTDLLWYSIPPVACKIEIPWHNEKFQTFSNCSLSIISCIQKPSVVVLNVKWKLPQTILKNYLLQFIIWTLGHKSGFWHFSNCITKSLKCVKLYMVDQDVRYGIAINPPKLTNLSKFNSGHEKSWKWLCLRLRSINYHWTHISSSISHGIW